jgi:hypothetical protein
MANGTIVSLRLLTFLVTMMILFPWRTNCFSFSRQSYFFRRQVGGRFNVSPRVPVATRASISKSAIVEKEGIKKNDQDLFAAEMKDWQGTSKSTSEFVTHFIASLNNITVEEAIHSVLPNTVVDSNDEGITVKRRGDLLEKDSDDLLKRLDMKFRHDPSQFPLHEQLPPADLLAMGSIWFLPANGPKDPGTCP